MARPHFNELCTLSEASLVVAALNAAGIGGGVKRLYDGQDPAEDGVGGTIFGKTIDPDNIEDKMYQLEYNDVPGSRNVAIIKEIMMNPINGPLWKQHLMDDLKDQRPADNK